MEQVTDKYIVRNCVNKQKIIKTSLGQYNKYNNNKQKPQQKNTKNKYNYKTH